MSQPPDEPDVLELRIHGVNNTSPAGMLDLPEYKIEQVAGDRLGSFWRPRPPGGDPPTPAPATRLEAYSWGGMARSTPGPTGSGSGAAVSVLGRIGWALLLPFGLANLAYWTRRLPADRSRAGWFAGNGAAGLRLFGVGLTALLVITTCDLALELVARQCYLPGLNGKPQCAYVPEAAAGWSLASRLAVASLVPLALLLGLWFLARRSRVRYERYGPDAPAATPAPTAPVLAAPELWSGEDMLRGLTWLHISTGLGLITLATAAPAVLGRPEAAGGADGWIFGTIMIAASAVMLAAAVLICRRAGDGPDVPRPTNDAKRVKLAPLITVNVAGALFVVQTILLLIRQPDISSAEPLAGFNASAIAVAMLIGLAVAGLAVRSGSSAVPLLLGAVVAAFLCLTRLHWTLVLGAALAAVVVLALGRRTPAVERRQTAWSGAGPGVVLGVALLVALTESSMVVLGAGQLLNGGNAARNLIPGSERPAATSGNPQLDVPLVYVWFGVALVLVLLVVFVLVLFVAMTATLANMLRRQNLPPDGKKVPYLVWRPRYWAHTEPDAGAWRARYWAALAQRPERIVGVLSGIGLVTAAAAVTCALGPPAALLDADWVGFAAGFSVLVVVAAAAALVGSVASSGGTRPLGLVWDLLCFLPRCAHPFAAPCYAERAVPELVDRCDSWLAGDPSRRVVLSAHSLGAVLAVAAVFTPEQPQGRPRLTATSLLTYGVQLRPYFGRIFPELLGPAVQGTPRCVAPRLTGLDPWRKELVAEEDATAAPAEAVRAPEPAAAAADTDDTLRAKLTADDRLRWISLWRRSDYLGFPVYGYVEDDNPIDRLAEEVVKKAVYTHGDYPRADAYRRALADLVAR